MSDTTEQSIRERLRNGDMVDAKFAVLYRPAGGTKAIIDIEGVKFVVEDSTRPLRAGLVNHPKSKRHAKAYTESDFDQFPILTNDDFVAYDRKHVPRNYKPNANFNSKL